MDRACSQNRFARILFTEDLEMKITKLPAPPMKLGKTARPYWDSIGKMLVKAGNLQDSDLHALALLARCFADVDAAGAAVDAEGYTVASARGSAKGNPAARQLTMAKAAAIQLLQQFGMTPVSRNRAPKHSPEGLDALTEFTI
jgi:P27 family predicted phage terminase small subunit